MLGFRVVFQTVNQEADEKVTFLKLGHTVIETYENKHAAMEMNISRYEGHRYAFEIHQYT